MGTRALTARVVKFKPKKILRDYSLQDYIVELCLVRGDITLSTGIKSDTYFNMKPLMMNPASLQLACHAIAAKIPDGTDYIGGLEMGAVPLTAGVLALHEGGLKGFFIRKQAKAHGLQKRIEGIAEGESLEGKQVVMIEDVTTSGGSALRAIEAVKAETSGGSALRAIEAVKAEGAIVKHVITLLDREEGATENFAKAGIQLLPCLTKSDIIK